MTESMTESMTEMTESAIYSEQLDNGLWLVAQPIASAQSVAMELRLPAGTSQQPESLQGVATLGAEMICRGAGDLDAKAHCNALDQLGVDRGTGVRGRHMTLSAVMLAARFEAAMPLLYDMVLRPRLEAQLLEPSRQLALQDLDALEDEPQGKVMERLLAQHLSAPMGRSRYGLREHLEIITIDDLRQYWRDTFVPDGAILSFAGQFDWPKLRDQVQKQLGEWTGARAPATLSGQPPRGYFHENASSAQVHIAVAYESVAENDPRSDLQRAAVAVLSGGMSGRLFTEVREKRGLCYSVFASYGGDRDWGMVMAYAGTTTPRAQETYDVLTGELRRLADGIDQDEFDRAIVGMKSRLVRSGESTQARASAIASDQYVFGRPRTLEELAERVDAIGLDDLRDYVASHRPENITAVTIGANPLEVG